MASFTQQVTNTVNDGCDDGSTYFDSGPTAGPDSFFGATYTAGLRFTSVAIANGTTISGATLTLYSAGTDSALSATLHGVAADSVSQFTSLNKPSSQSKTSASASVGHGGALNTQYTIDVTTVVQEILSRGGWASGNALAFVIEATGSTASWGDWGQIGRPSASLSITYSGGSSTYNETLPESLTAADSLTSTLVSTNLTEALTAAATFTAVLVCRPSLAEALTATDSLTVRFNGWSYDAAVATTWSLSSASAGSWTPITPTSTSWS